jgi:hypothetical protein
MALETKQKQIKLCECGCGNPTKIRKGKQNRFVSSHNSRMGKLLSFVKAREIARKLGCAARLKPNIPNYINKKGYPKVCPMILVIHIKTKVGLVMLTS